MNEFASSTAWIAWPWNACTVHFHEIVLKGGNRPRFIQRLAENVRCVMRPYEGVVDARHDRLLVRSPRPVSEWIESVARIFGIAYVVPVHFLEKDVARLAASAVAYYKDMASPGASCAIRARCSDPGFPLRGMELEREIGTAVVAACGAPVNLTAPDLQIDVRVTHDNAYLAGPRYTGPGGLPMGVTGRVLCLFSGGIDSPVAAWSMMRRGCRVEDVHFHMSPDVERLRDSKIVRLIEQLVRPQGVSVRLFLVPYLPFQFALMNTEIPQDLELITFRRFLIRVSDALAYKYRYEALVTGDNLGQVASQTLKNLSALEGVAHRPVFRPLLTQEKQEVIDRAKQIGTYQTAIEPYHDCCSLLAKRPNTGPRRTTVERFESQMDVAAVMQKALAETVSWTIA